MKIDGKEVPFTATHYSHKSKEFLRIGRNGYAEVYLNNRFWCECPTLRNADLPLSRHDIWLPQFDGYTRLFKTGMARDFCNIRLFFIGSSYRIGDFK